MFIQELIINPGDGLFDVENGGEIKSDSDVNVS